MRLLFLILLTILVSCGSGSDSQSHASCTIEATAVNEIWVSNTSSNRYDMRACVAGNDCTVCNNPSFCNSMDDFIINYSNGAFSINYFNAGRVVIGSYQVCVNELQLYNLNNGYADETFTKGE